MYTIRILNRYKSKQIHPAKNTTRCKNIYRQIMDILVMIKPNVAITANTETQ